LNSNRGNEAQIVPVVLIHWEIRMPSGLLSSFVTLFVTIGPIETAVIFAGLTSGVHHKERRSLALRSVTIAGLMLVLFCDGRQFSAVVAARLAAGLSRGRWNVAVPAGVDADIFEPPSFLDQRAGTARQCGSSPCAARRQPELKREPSPATSDAGSSSWPISCVKTLSELMT
jgi:hypothetical protein